MRIGYIEIRVYTDDIYSNEGLRGAKQKLISDKRKFQDVDNQTQLTKDSAQISRMVCSPSNTLTIDQGYAVPPPTIHYTSLYIIAECHLPLLVPGRMLSDF